MVYYWVNHISIITRMYIYIYTRIYIYLSIYQFFSGSELQAIEVLGPDQRKLLSAFGVFKKNIYIYIYVYVNIKTYI